MTLQCEGVHVSYGEGEEHLSPCVLADGVGGHGGAGTGDATGVVVDGDVVGVEVSGVFEEVEGRAAGRREVADNKESTSL